MANPQAEMGRAGSARAQKHPAAFNWLLDKQTKHHRAGFLLGEVEPDRVPQAERN